MIKLSVNLNKIALLRNARGRDYPNVIEFAKRFIDLGVAGITVHPRQDERHITGQDAYDLGKLLIDYPDVEYNIEGYPSADFLALVHAIKPDQCTLVPDSPDQLTSDHGWDLHVQSEFLRDICFEFNNQSIRSALFIDPDIEQISLVPKTQAKRVELYTEAYANAYKTNKRKAVLEQYRLAAEKARSLGLGVNAGHDLDLDNLSCFLSIESILEVSIGHALTIESIERGMESVVAEYVSICGQSEEK